MLLFNMNVFGVEHINCYPIEKNNLGITNLCVKPIDTDTNDIIVSLELFDGDKLVYSISGVTKYLPSRIVCTGKEHDCRELPEIIFTQSDSAKNSDNGIKIHLYYWLTKPESCRNGRIEIVNRPRSYQELQVKCPEYEWGN